MSEVLLYRDLAAETRTGDDTTGGVKRFRGGLVFEAHRRLYHSTLGFRVIQKKTGGGEVDMLCLS